MATLPNIKPFPQQAPSYELLIRRNKMFKERFKRNLLFKLMESGYFNSDEKKNIFLGYFQVWSNYFQKTMLLKTALCDDPNFTPIFYQHFTEEFGHDQMLDKDRPQITPKKDAVLEALCNWFFSKMLSFSSQEQIVVMNLCVEGSAIIFYEFSKPAIDPNNQLKHFQAHGEIDHCHEGMGLSLLDGLPEFQLARLFEIQEETWAMMNALMKRLGELVQENFPQ